MNFNEFVLRLSEYYGEKPSQTYIDLLKMEVGSFRDFQFEELFLWLIRNVERSYKSLPGINWIDKAKECNSIRLFPAKLKKRIENKSQEENQLVNFDFNQFRRKIKEDKKK